jgi:tyrosinase
MAWWDEAKDADSGIFYQSNIWDSNAFGGNGTGADACIVDGAFANYTEHIGPLLTNTDYCMSWAWNNTLGVESANSEVVAGCTGHDNYYDFLYCWFNGPHVVGHTATGGIVSFRSQFLQPGEVNANISQ